MEAFTVMTAVAAPMLRDNIDTDIIIPSREMLLEGLDAIDLTLKHRVAIQQFIDQDRRARPWIYPGGFT